MSEKKRKITKKDRKIWRNNALKGTAKWKKTPKGARKAERSRAKHGWGFSGKSPSTEQRKYRNKSAAKSGKGRHWVKGHYQRKPDGTGRMYIKGHWAEDP